MSRREFEPSIRNNDAGSRPRPSTAPGLLRPTSAVSCRASSDANAHLFATKSQRPASACPPSVRPASPGTNLSVSVGTRPASALSIGSKGVGAGGGDRVKPLLPIHIDSKIFRTQKYAIVSPAEIYNGTPLAERDLESNLMVNFALRGSVPPEPPPEMSIGFLEPKPQESQGIQRKIARCIRTAAAYRARGEVEAAMAQYTQMLKLHPHDYDILSCVGAMLCRVGETTVAVKALSRACQCRPSSAVAHYNLGCAHLHHIQRQPTKGAREQHVTLALNAFDRCIAIAPISEAFAARSLCRRHCGDFLGATEDYNLSKTAASAYAMSKELAPQLHREWEKGAALLTAAIQMRKDASQKMEKAKRKEAVAEVERKQRVMLDLFADAGKKLNLNSSNHSSDENNDNCDEAAVSSQTKPDWASDSSSSDEEGRIVAAAVDEDYLSHYASVASSTANSLHAEILMARSKGIERLEAARPMASTAGKNISRMREVADSVVTLSDHEMKLQSASPAASRHNSESLGSPSATTASVLLAPSDTLKSFRARQRWLVCKRFIRSYGPVAIPVQRRTHRQVAKVVDMIKRFEFLNKLPPYVLSQVAQCVRPRLFEAGDMIIRQGSAGTSLFIIMLGHVDVAVHFGEPKQAVLSLAKRVAGFTVGQAFGETAFTSAAPRSAFCLAVNSVVAAELLKEDFDRIKKAYDTGQTNLKMEALKQLSFIGTDLDPTQLERFAKIMTPFAQPPQTTLFTQGDKCATMYFITEGQVSFFRRPSDGCLRSNAIALQRQFDMEERYNSLESSRQDSAVEAASCSPDAAGSRPSLSASERRNAFLEMSALMDADPLDDPDPRRTKARKIALGKKLLYAAQIGAFEARQSGVMGETQSSSKHSAGAAALDLMGRVDDLDRLLDGAKAASAEFPEGRIFEDRDNSNKLVRQHGWAVMTVFAPCLINHEGVVCCGDRKGFSGASLFTAILPLHCTGYQILRPHFQTCGPNVEKIVEENFAQRVKDMCSTVKKAIEWRKFKDSLMKQQVRSASKSAAR